MADRLTIDPALEPLIRCAAALCEASRVLARTDERYATFADGREIASWMC